MIAEGELGPEAELLDLERAFWTGGADVYRRALAEECVMLLPEPAGVLTKHDTVEAIERSPRWSDVRCDDCRAVRLSDDAAFITYHAQAHRGGAGSAYRAH